MAPRRPCTGAQPHHIARHKCQRMSTSRHRESGQGSQSGSQPQALRHTRLSSPPWFQAGEGNGGRVRTFPTRFAPIRTMSPAWSASSAHMGLAQNRKRPGGHCPSDMGSTPSSSVSDEKGLHCRFGCKARGIAINFLLQPGGYRFRGAAVRPTATTAMASPRRDASDREEIVRTPTGSISDSAARARCCSASRSAGQDSPPRWRRIARCSVCRTWPT